MSPMVEMVEAAVQFKILVLLLAPSVLVAMEGTEGQVRPAAVATGVTAAAAVMGVLAVREAAAAPAEVVREVRVAPYA